MSKYDKLIKENLEGAAKEKKAFSKAIRGTNEIIQDENRRIDLYDNAHQSLLEIDEAFSKATGLNKVDISFLMLATALQIGRWIIISIINDEYSKKINVDRVAHDDQSVKDMERLKREDYKDEYIAKHGDAHKDRRSRHRDWANIVFDSVPYDISKGSPAFGVNMGAGYHRIHTLGHDPVLGWIFGTMNILSDTITLDKTYAFSTFYVEMMQRPKRWTGRSTLFNSFADAIDSVKEDKTRLPAAVFAQGLHLESDVYTKLGLPVPVLEAFDPEFASKIYKEGYDTLKLLEDIQPFAINGLQMAASIVINLIISLLHGLFYDPLKYKDRDLYEVKTRKILSISNTIATSSNLIWVGGNVVSGNQAAIKDLDVGGLLVTVYRLVSDTLFIRKIKQEYLEKQWAKEVVGSEYSFMKED